MFEVVEFRNCDDEICSGEKETVLFQHNAIEECRAFMLRFWTDSPAYAGSEHFPNDKNRMNVLLFHPLVEGKYDKRKLRVQEVNE